MNAHTKQQQDKVFETDFVDSQNSNPPFAHLLALSHIYIWVILLKTGQKCDIEGNSSKCEFFMLLFGNESLI